MAESLNIISEIEHGTEADGDCYLKLDHWHDSPTNQEPVRPANQAFRHDSDRELSTLITTSDSSEGGFLRETQSAISVF